jgi:hypothetical protein
MHRALGEVARHMCSDRAVYSADMAVCCIVYGGCTVPLRDVQLPDVLVQCTWQQQQQQRCLVLC